MPTAWQVAAGPSPARLAHADTVHGPTIKTDLVTVDTSPASSAVGTHGGIDFAVTYATVVAGGSAGTDRDAAVIPSPVGADTLVVKGVAGTMAVAVAIRAWATRRDTLGAGVERIARTGVVAATGAVASTGQFAVGTRGTAVAHALVVRASSRPTAESLAVGAKIARVAHTLTGRATTPIPTASCGSVALHIASIATVPSVASTSRAVGRGNTIATAVGGEHTACPREAGIATARLGVGVPDTTARARQRVLHLSPTHRPNAARGSQRVGRAASKVA